MKFENFFETRKTFNKEGDLEEGLNLEKRIGQLDKNSEKLEFLISTIDKLIFPENPLPIKERKFRKNEKGMYAKYSAIIKKDKITGKESIQEKYEINKIKLNKKRFNTETIFNLAVHEIRHRIQFANEKEGSKFQIFTEKELLDLFDLIPEIKSLKNYPKIQRYLEIRKKEAGNTKNFNKEIDAIIIGTTAEILFRKREKIMAILEIIKSDNKEKVLEILKENKKDFLESVSSKIKENFIEIDKN